MMTLRVRLKEARKQNQPRLRFDLEKLKSICGMHFSSNDSCATQWTDEDLDINTIIITYDTAVTDAATWEGTLQEKGLDHQRYSRPL